MTLLEKSGQLGGQWIPASMPVGKSEFTSLLLWQKAMLEKLHIQVLLNTRPMGSSSACMSPTRWLWPPAASPLCPAS